MFAVNETSTPLFLITAEFCTGSYSFSSLGGLSTAQKTVEVMTQCDQEEACLRVTIAMMKHHDQKQLGERSFYLAYISYTAIYSLLLSYRRLYQTPPKGPSNG